MKSILKNIMVFLVLISLISSSCSINVFAENEELDFVNEDVIQKGVTKVSEEQTVVEAEEELLPEIGPELDNNEPGDSIGNASEVTIEEVVEENVEDSGNAASNYVESYDNSLTPNDGTRYTVLAIDCSGSMKGTPMEVAKQSAIKFCNSVTSANGVNYVAVVRYSSEVRIACSFTNDAGKVSMAVNQLNATGGTDMCDALDLAKQMLDSAPKASIKNLVLLSDGLPNEGAESNSGPFSSARENAVYNKALEVTETINLYTLGFFHALSGDNLKKARRLMEDIQNAGYYDVLSADDLEFAFQGIADDIIQDKLIELYIEDHKEYYLKNFDKEILEIQIPDEECSFDQDYFLGNIVLDASQNTEGAIYFVVKDIVDVINLDGIDFDVFANDYHLILADLVNDTVREQVESNFLMAELDRMIKVAQELQNWSDRMGKEEIDLKLKRLGVTLEQYRADWAELAHAIDQVKIGDDSGEFGELFGKLSIVVDKYVTTDEYYKVLEEASKITPGMKDIAKDIKNDALLGGTIKTVSDIIQYSACYDSYMSVSDDFIEFLRLLYSYAESNTQIRGIDQPVFSESLMTAIDDFMDQIKLAKSGAKDIALSLVKKGVYNFGTEGAKAAISALLDVIPGVSTLNQIRKAIGMVGNGVLFFTDVVSEIDDRAYQATMIEELYYLSALSRTVTNHYGQDLLDGSTSLSDAFKFHNSLEIWKWVTNGLCDVGMKYEQSKLDSAFTGQKTESWNSTAISLAAIRKVQISNIRCHGENYDYNPLSGLMQPSAKMQIVTIACPVSVTVLNEKGTIIASISGGNVSCPSEYAPWFHSFSINNEKDDFATVCYIPSTWRINFNGTDTGAVQILVGHIENGRYFGSQVFRDIMVTKDSKGTISSEADEAQVILNNRVIISDSHTHTFVDDKCEKCGRKGGNLAETISWTLTDNGTLIISGTGNMPGYWGTEESPLSTLKNVKGIILEEGITSAGRFAFCHLEASSVRFAKSLKRIESGSFALCENLKEIIIPENVEFIGYDVFIGCTSLTRFRVVAGNTHFSTDGTVLFENSQTSLICANHSLEGAYSIPETVVLIDEGAFHGCDLLTDITIPHSVKRINANAFCLCSGLKQIIIPESVEQLGDYCFSMSGIKTIIFEGKAPDSIYSNAMEWATITAYYPEGDPTWTSEKLKNYGGIITWKSYPAGQLGLAITIQPQNVTAGIKSQASFHIEGNLINSYQWQYSKNNGAKWINCASTGANTDTLSLSVSLSNANNIYRCIITGPKGITVISDTARVELLPGAVITLNPKSNAVAIGEYATFTVETENAASFQWQYSKDGAHWYKSGAEGNQTDTLTVKGEQKSQGNRYRCVVTGIDGNTKKSYMAAMIVMTEAPKTCTAAVGEMASYTVKAEGIAEYQWQYSKNGGQTWYKSSAEGATTDTVTFKASSSNRAMIYRCKLTTPDEATAFTKPVGFAEGLKITEQPVDVNAALGEKATFKVVARNVESYQWQYSKDGVKWSNSGIATAKTDSITVTVAEANKNNVYRCKLVGTDGTVEYTNTVSVK